MSLKGRVAIVTGGARDIGAAIVRKLATEGASVVVNYHSSADEANALVAELRKNGATAVAVQADVSNANDVARLVKETQSAFGVAIHIVVNNAGGILARKKLDEMDGKFWDDVMALNVRSVFLVAQAVVPHMPEGSAMVNIASLAARDGGGGGALAYSAAKGAVLTLTRGLSKELAPKRIRVNCVSPGMIATKFHDTFTKPEIRQATAARTTVGREGSADDVANAVLFLASEQSAYINGESVEINGGLYFN